MPKPYVSVVVATYNRKEQLKECLNSLFNQTYPKDRYEIIVVNDGSIDGTEEVLKEYERRAPCRFKWFTQKNQGVAVAMNLGIKNATGEIICFTGDDCVADKYWIEKLVDGFTDEKIGGVGGEIVAYNPKTLAEKYGNPFDQKRNAKEYLLTGNAAYKKHILEKIGGFDSNLRSLVDPDLGIRVKAEGYELKYVPGAIVYHRHYQTLSWLIKRNYFLGLMFCRLSRKYTHHFFMRYYIPKYTLILIKAIIIYPFGIIFYKKRKDFVIRNFFQILIIASTLAGMLKGVVTEKYLGEKFEKKLDFLGEESFRVYIKKILKKLFKINAF